MNIKSLTSNEITPYCRIIYGILHNNEDLLNRNRTKLTSFLLDKMKDFNLVEKEDVKIYTYGYLLYLYTLFIDPAEEIQKYLENDDVQNRLLFDKLFAYTRRIESHNTVSDYFCFVSIMMVYEKLIANSYTFNLFAETLIPNLLHYFQTVIEKLSVTKKPFVISIVHQILIQISYYDSVPLFYNCNLQSIFSFGKIGDTDILACCFASLNRRIGYTYVPHFNTLHDVIQIGCMNCYTSGFESSKNYLVVMTTSKIYIYKVSEVSEKTYSMIESRFNFSLKYRLILFSFCDVLGAYIEPDEESVVENLRSSIRIVSKEQSLVYRVVDLNEPETVSLFTEL